MFDVCLNFSVRKASRVLNKIYDRHLQDTGLKCSQFTILRVIDHLEQTTSLQLIDIMVIDQTTLSRSLKPLIRDGLIEVTPGEDRRYKLLSLTPQGKKSFKRASRAWQAAQEEIKSKLSGEQLDELLSVTDAVAHLEAN